MTQTKNQQNLTADEKFERWKQTHNPEYFERMNKFDEWLMDMMEEISEVEFTTHDNKKWTIFYINYNEAFKRAKEHIPDMSDINIYQHLSKSIYFLWKRDMYEIDEESKNNVGLTITFYKDNKTRTFKEFKRNKSYDAHPLRIEGCDW